MCIRSRETFFASHADKIHCKRTRLFAQRESEEFLLLLHVTAHVDPKIVEIEQWEVVHETFSAVTSRCLLFVYFLYFLDEFQSFKDDSLGSFYRTHLYIT